MTHCVCVVSMLGVAIVGSYVITAQTGDNRYVVIITAIGSVLVAFFTMITIAAPHASKAIVTLGATILPAWVSVKKTLEDLNKGLLSQQIEALTSQNRELTEQLRQIKDQFIVTDEEHKRQRTALIAQLETNASELAILRSELAEARAEIAEGGHRQRKQIEGVQVMQQEQERQLQQTQAGVEENKQELAKVSEQIHRGSSDQIPTIKGD